MKEQAIEGWNRLFNLYSIFLISVCVELNCSSSSSVHNSGGKKIGDLNITVEAVDALTAIKSEMKNSVGS